MADISITAASVAPSNTAHIITKTAGATITAGQALYVKADGTMGLCDADVAAPVCTFAGIALNGASSGQPVSYTDLDLSGLTIGATVAAGVILCTSNTAGGIRPSSDSATGQYVTVLGPVTAANKLLLNPTGQTSAAA